MKTVSLIIGGLAILMGLLWIGQGLGYVMWPASSFMLEQKIWAMWGTILAAVGIGMITFARRR